MPSLPPDRSSDRQHLAVALLTLWLLITSPWVSMLRRIPPSAGWLDYAHVVLGLLALVLGVAYAWSCTRGERWRLYFPWTPSELRSVGRDLAGLLRGCMPSSEGGGLFGLIEGLLLLLLLATALTGAGWLATQGSDAALAWREYHALAARGLVGLLVLHVVTVSLHLTDFLRD
jgi:hypothetical protein